MAYFLPRRWRRQPQIAVEIDRGHWLAQDLRFFVTNSGGVFRDLVKGAIATRNGTGLSTNGFNPRTGPSTAARIQSANSNYLEVAHDTSYSITGDLSLLLSGQVNSGGAYRHLLGKHTGNGATNAPFDFRTDNGSTPIMQLVRSNAGSSQSISGPSIPLGSPAHFGVTSQDNSTAVSFYINGAQSNQLAAANVTTTANTAPLRIGRRADGAVQLDGWVEFGAGWARVLSGDAFLAMRDNPWQFMRPLVSRTYFEIPTVAGGSTYNDSISESSSATDSVASIATLGGALTESVTAADTPAAALVAGGAVSEAGTATDTPGATAVLAGAVSEAASAGDSDDASLIAAGAVSEAGSASDSTAAGATLGGAVSETVTAADTSASAQVIADSISESGAAEDSVGGEPSNVSSVSETASAAMTTDATVIAACGVVEALSAADTFANTAGLQAAFDELASADAFLVAGTVYDADVSESASADYTAGTVTYDMVEDPNFVAVARGASFEAKARAASFTASARAHSFVARPTS